MFQDGQPAHAMADFQQTQRRIELLDLLLFHLEINVQGRDLLALPLELLGLLVQLFLLGFQFSADADQLLFLLLQGHTSRVVHVVTIPSPGPDEADDDDGQSGPQQAVDGRQRFGNARHDYDSAFPVADSGTVPSVLDARRAHAAARTGRGPRRVPRLPRPS